MADVFKLPGSSYEELVKIIMAYSTGKIGQPMSLDALAQSTGMDKTIVSRNNGFLVQTELISEGNKKAPTELGVNLGRAYSLKMDEQISKVWIEVVNNSEFLNRMLSAIKIRNGMEKNSFINHILYSSGNGANKNTKAGANTVIEIYKTAGLVTETDGKITACEVEEGSNTENTTDLSQTSQANEPVNEQQFSLTTSSGISVNVNINIDVKFEELDELPAKIRILLNNIHN